MTCRPRLPLDGIAVACGGSSSSRQATRAPNRRLQISREKPQPAFECCPSTSPTPRPIHNRVDPEPRINNYPASCRRTRDTRPRAPCPVVQGGPVPRPPLPRSPETHARGHGLIPESSTCVLGNHKPFLINSRICCQIISRVFIPRCQDGPARVKAPAYGDRRPVAAAAAARNRVLSTQHPTAHAVCAATYSVRATF